jgi:hypothetical protein
MELEDCENKSEESLNPHYRRNNLERMLLHSTFNPYFYY